MAASGSAQKVKYELPYPGLLPDNPLYSLRIIRDRVVDFLISDPLKKAEFNLLQADKRLNAGIYLFNSANKNNKKIELAISTISKAENYFEKAIQKLKEANQEGKDIKELTRKLRDSAKKHQEEILSLIEKSPKDFKENFKDQLKRVGNFERETKSFSSK